jgi:predicted PurR-regulated permease PerM
VNDDNDRSLKLSTSTEELVVVVIRIVCLGLLGYWSLILITPFLAIIVWSIIVTVALYPIFDWLSARLCGHRVLAAVAITVFTFLVVLGPATWLALSLADTVRVLLARFGDGNLAIPPPSETVKAWPLIGEKIYETWQLASTNLRALFIEVAPQLKPLGASLLNTAGSVGINLLKFIVALIISGFLFIPGRALITPIKNIVGRVAIGRGEEFVDLAGATIRNISRGIIGIAILQALLAGIGLLFAGVPAAGLFSFLVLFLGIIQIGPSVVIVPLIIWSWFSMDTTVAIVFTLYMVPVNLLDNVLRPLVAKRSENTDAGDINRCPWRHARAWLDGSICRTDCTFDCLAVARGLDIRRYAQTHRRGHVRPEIVERTRARRLAEEGVTLNEVLQELKESSATRFLEDNRMPISRIAWVLGFEQASSFSHACRRWTGKSPRELRRSA